MKCGTLKPRVVEHTHIYIFLDVAIRNSLRSNNQVPKTQTRGQNQQSSPCACLDERGGRLAAQRDEKNRVCCYYGAVRCGAVLLTHRVISLYNKTAPKRTVGFPPKKILTAPHRTISEKKLRMEPRSGLVVYEIKHSATVRVRAVRFSTF